MLENFHIGDVLLHLLNAVLLFVIVRFLIYKPVRKFMQARSERIAASLDEAAQARAESEALRKEGGLIIEQAEASARVKALEITGAANESARAMTESAREESRAILEKARAEAQAERGRAMAGLRDEVVDLAAEMAAQILKSGPPESPQAFWGVIEGGGTP